MNNNDNENIVVIDDEKHVCNIIVEALTEEKYNVVSYTDPNAGLEYIRENKVDLVLTDLVMGEFSGMEILETALSNHKDAIVIIMTAHPTVESAISVLKKGAYNFLIKPFKLEILKAAIKRGLDHQRVIRDNVNLKGQVDFLKAANAGVATKDIETYLKLVVDSCKKELSAKAVSLMEIDPKSKEVIRAVYNSDKEDFLNEISNDSTLLDFTYTKSAKPKIQKEQIEYENMNARKIFISQPIFFRRKLLGIINLLILNRFDELTPGQLDVLSILSNSAASAISNYRLYQDLQASYLQAIKALANAVEARDAYTKGHTDRVCLLAKLIAIQMGWDETQILNLVMGCTLHDIGKIGVPDSILNKPDDLLDEERKKMANHPKLGLKILRGIDLFKPAIPYVLAHHESYDGTGYPKGLKGEEIPIEGRLLAVADTFDAIMSDRPYRKGNNLETAVSELIKYKGIQFDPKIVDVLIDLIRKGMINFKELYDRDEDINKVNELLTNEKAPV